MKYLFDNCISYRFAYMLAALDVESVPLREVYAESIADAEFLRTMKAAHDVYVTYDHQQRHRRDEALAIKESGVTSLWLGPFWGKKEFWAQAAWLVAKWPTIDAFVCSAVRGTCAEIKENGKARPFAL